MSAAIGSPQSDEVGIPLPENMPIALPVSPSFGRPLFIGPPTPPPQEEEKEVRTRSRRRKSKISDVQIFDKRLLEQSDTAMRRDLDELATGENDDGELRRKVQRQFIAWFSYSGTCLRGLPHLEYVLALPSPFDSDMQSMLIVPWLSAVLQNPYVAKLLLTPERAAVMIQWLKDNAPGLPGVMAGELTAEYTRDLFPLPLQASTKETIAPTMDQSLVWILQAIYGVPGRDPVTLAEDHSILQLRRTLMAGTAGEDAFGGPVIPMTRTKQFLAPLFTRQNIRNLQRLAREQAASGCREMERPNNTRCNNEEGNLTGDSWCDVPAWAYHRDSDGYCYDIRELLTKLAEFTYHPGLPEPPPTYPWTRKPIDPRDIFKWMVTASERGWPVHVNIMRILKAYRISPNVTLPLGGYYRLLELDPELEEQLQSAIRGREWWFFNPDREASAAAAAAAAAAPAPVAPPVPVPPSPFLLPGPQIPLSPIPSLPNTPPPPPPPFESQYHRRRRPSSIRI